MANKKTVVSRLVNTPDVSKIVFTKTNSTLVSIFSESKAENYTDSLFTNPVFTNQDTTVLSITGSIYENHVIIECLMRKLISLLMRYRFDASCTLLFEL